MENSNREAGVKDIVNYMVALDASKSKSRMKLKSSSSTKISQPSIQCPVGAYVDHVNSYELGYQKVMSCILGLSQQVM